MRPSARVQQTKDPVIPIIAELIRQNSGTISLGQGVVYYPPPKQAFERLEQFFAEPSNHKYQPDLGIPALREAFQKKLKAENGHLQEEGTSVIVTAGANMAFLQVLLCITDAGDEIILQTPYYFNHDMAITMTSCHPVIVPTDSNYQLQLDAIAAAITPRTRAVVTVSPNNPTGVVYSEAALRAVNRLCAERGIYHIHDEAYEYFTFDGAKHLSPASFVGSAGHTISIYSLSKSYGFASWRIAYLALPNSLMPAMEKVQDTNIICPPVISQYAALGALEAGAAYCREKIATIGALRSTVKSLLEPLHDSCVIPETEGAFYYFLKVDTTCSSMELARRLIQEYKVAVMPGVAFGMTEGCYLRISYGALEAETVLAGIGRFVEGMTQILKGERGVRI